MKKYFLAMVASLIMISCGSTMSFQNFFNNHKREVGVTAFQVPNFMRALVRNISPEINNLFGNVRDFKFITFDAVSQRKQAMLIQELDLITATKFTDILRKNTVEKTKIISVIEEGDVVTQAIIFNSSQTKTTAFYLKGRFDPNKIRELSEANQFENLSNKLLQNYNSGFTTPGFNKK